MERTFRFEMLGGERFVFGLKDVARQKRNRSYANASNCCGVELKQKKVCSGCGVEVDAKDSQRKIFKLGKESHLIDAQALKRITDELGEHEDVVFHTVLERLPSEFGERVDSVMWVLPGKKGERAYDELRTAIGAHNLVGKGVFRGNEFEVVLRAGADGVLRLYRLVEPSQFHEVPSVVVGDVGNPEVVAMASRLFGKSAVAEYDFGGFRDSRAKVEESLIESAVLGGEVPEVKSVSVAEEKDAERLARMKALLDGGA